MMERPAQAQNYPARPVKLVVPYAPGSPNDIVAPAELTAHMKAEIGKWSKVVREANIKIE